MVFLPNGTLAPRTGRAPLGNKTTNAKARATHQTPGNKAVARDLERAAAKPTATVKPKPSAPQVESSKLEVHIDKDPLKEEEEEIEYAPPKPKDLPYESDVFPDGVLTFEGLKPENLFKGYYQYYFNREDEKGRTAVERDLEERQKRSFERGEEQIRKDMDEFIWNVGEIADGKDMPRQKDGVLPSSVKATSSNRTTRSVQKQPSTLASRKAAAALTMPATSSTLSQAKSTKTAAPSSAKAPAKGILLPKRKPSQLASQPTTTIPIRERAPALAASRSTLGYNKGRSVSSAVNGMESTSTTRQTQAQTSGKPRTLGRSASTASSGSDTTITPARFAPSSEIKKPDFLSIFDGDDEEDTLGGGMPPMDDDYDDFQLTLKFE